MSQILPFLAHMGQTTFERAGMLRPDALPALELLNSLYPIINNVGFSNVQHTEPMLAPPTCTSIPSSSQISRPKLGKFFPFPFAVIMIMIIHATNDPQDRGLKVKVLR